MIDEKKESWTTKIIARLLGDDFKPPKLGQKLTLFDLFKESEEKKNND